MRPLLALCALLVVASCTFERRPDLAGSGEGDSTRPAVPSGPHAAAEDSVRAVVAAFREALRLGDVTRVAQLSTPDAALVDQEEHVHWSRSGSSESRLPAPLDGRREGLGWVLEDSSFDTLGASALLVNRYSATVSGEDVPWAAIETFVFVRTPEGWRLRHLHRSRGLSDDPS